MKAKNYTTKQRLSVLETVVSKLYVKITEMDKELKECRNEKIDKG
tara:strand:- start:6592 stop:6726 length:135 start_codon:yes stop_codon:yes gene_type:complete